MLTPMRAETAHVTRTPRQSAVNILCAGNANAHYILWLASLTGWSEFHLYYDI